MNSPRLLASLLLLTIAAGCGSSSDPYPIHAGSEHGGGTTGWAGINEEGSGGSLLYVAARAGDTIELLSAEVVEATPGADVAFIWQPMMLRDGRWRLGPASPIEGAIITFNPAQPLDRPGVILATITPHRAGRWAVSSVRLRFRINGGPVQVREGGDNTVVVCAGDHPELAECPFEDPSASS